VPNENGTDYLENYGELCASCVQQSQAAFAFDSKCESKSSFRTQVRLTWSTCEALFTYPLSDLDGWILPPLSGLRHLCTCVTDLVSVVRQMREWTSLETPESLPISSLHRPCRTYAH
jgi:hypothetical protein